MFRIVPFWTTPLVKTSVILLVSDLLKRHTHQILCSSRSFVSGCESCLTSVLESSGRSGFFCTPRDLKTQANWLETKSKFSDHAFRPRLPTTPFGHVFQPRLPATPSDHAFQPRLPTCFSMPSDDSSRKTGGSGSIFHNRMNSEHTIRTSD